MEALENSRVTRLFAVTSLIRNMLALLDMESRKDNKPNRLSKVSKNVIFHFFRKDPIFLLGIINGLLKRS